jgi:hypothetical protein
MKLPKNKNQIKMAIFRKLLGTNARDYLIASSDIDQPISKDDLLIVVRHLIDCVVDVVVDDEPVDPSIHTQGKGKENE